MMRLNIERKDVTSSGENPLATSLYNVITNSQMNEIRQLSDQLGVAHSQISQTLFGLPFDHLSQSGAEDVINILIELTSNSETIH
ncbi:MAG TPA: hypothetical protein PKY82_25420 [Pyrinomonadaceae bacterium]|nr:hypothetical protein [Pyrinomonadaceae bacterium]